MGQVSMSEVRQRLGDIQDGIKVNLTQTKEYVPMSALAAALSEVFGLIDDLAAAIENLQRGSGMGD